MFSIGIINNNNKININIYHQYELESKDENEIKKYNIKYNNLDLFACFTILLKCIKLHGINSINSNFFNKEHHTETNIKYINKLYEILNNSEIFQNSDNFDQYFDDSGRLTCYF
jgi:hypothetical protein